MITPEDRASIEEVIKKTVNGKIDRLTELMTIHNDKHEKDMCEVRGHIEEVRPILQAYEGGKTLGNFLKWFGGVVTAGGVIWALFFKN